VDATEREFTTLTFVMTIVAAMSLSPSGKKDYFFPLLAVPYTITTTGVQTIFFWQGVTIAIMG
jgi:hypothetical protein